MFQTYLAPLKRRLIFFVAAMSTISIITVIFITFSTMLITKEARKYQVLHDVSSILVLGLEDPFSIEKTKKVFNGLSRNSPWPLLTSIAFVTPEGKVLASTRPLKAPPPAIKQAMTSQLFENSDFILFSQPVRGNGEVKGYVVLTKNLNEIDKFALLFVAVLSIAGTIGLLLSIFIARKLYRKMLAPLYSLTNAAKKIASDKDYTVRVPEGSSESLGELGDLVTQFNFMLEQVEARDKLLTAHQRTLEYAVKMRTSELVQKNIQLEIEVDERKKAEMIRCEVERINQHDLKSLLNLVIGYPELLLGKGDLSKQQEAYIKKIELAGFQMLDMINNNLDIFKMEQGLYKLRKTDVELVTLLQDIQDDLIALLNSLDVSVHIICDEESEHEGITAYATGEYRLLRTLFSNLITNAIEASEYGGIVTVNIESSAPSVTIHNSKPVPEEIKDRFFNKYVTHGKEDGTGLGTYSAQLIATAHNASIVMESTPESGTSVSVSFNETQDSDLEPPLEQVNIA